MGTQTYSERGKERSLLPPPYLHIPCRRLASVLLGLPLLGVAACSGESGGSPFLSEASTALLEQYESAEEAVDGLRVRARTAAVRLHTDAAAIDLDALREEMTTHIRALAGVEGSEDLPWSAWIEESRFKMPHLAREELLTASQVLADDALTALSLECDFREMPTIIRIVAHQNLWRLDPHLALARGRLLLFHEAPRARDQMRPTFVEEVLMQVEHPLVEELLLDAATHEAMEPRARTLATRQLGVIGSKDAPAILESLFDTESTNFLVRKEALLVILELEPERGHAILMDKMPSRMIDPGTWTFMKELRAREGLPMPSEDR